MLEDAAGIRRVVLACGTVDLRKASMAWQRLSAINTDKIRLKREISFYFAENVLIDAKDSYGWAQEFCFFNKRFEAGRLSWPRNIQEAAELTEEQYKYLMMGLNPLDPKIKDVDPKNIY